ncbi:hypothetical protein C2E23DRAFT_844367 [Lenzites betulinus]|nr:hypothetical protein C2E23DRAFT_844367 [Lenzites betulinus]
MSSEGSSPQESVSASSRFLSARRSMSTGPSSRSASPNNGSVSDEACQSSEKAYPKVAPEQPLTMHGKPRERVYLACEQCRNRKVRCDGAKPECHNCLRRKRPTGPCTYDEAPRRRGKDRMAGSRKLAPLVQKRTRTTRSRIEEEAKRKKVAKKTDTAHDASPPSCPDAESSSCDASSSSGSRSELEVTRTSTFDVIDLLLEPMDFLPASTYAPDPALPDLEENTQQRRVRFLAIAQGPHSQFVRETWWEALLALYAEDRMDALRSMTADLRSNASEYVRIDLRLLFRVSLLWFSFLDVPKFLSTLFNPAGRQALQPSLVLSALALATLLQSSEFERGEKGMNMALKLVEQAYAAFYSSLNSGWIDVGLTQAAYILTAFELHAHPKAKRPHRTQEALGLLNSLIRYLGLTTLDIDNPRTTIFLPNTVPCVRSEGPCLASTRPPAPSSAMKRLAFATLPFADEDETAQISSSSSVPLQDSFAATISGNAGCGCQAYSLGSHCPMAKRLAPQFAQMPMWPEAEPGEVLKEEYRRLVWASLILATAYGTTKVMAMAGEGWALDPLWIQEPSNYALLFPGENLADHGVNSTASSKDSVWALYMRALFLWDSCLNMQRKASAQPDEGLGATERTLFAMRACAEMNAIDAALERHTCMTETGFFIKIHEVLFNTRMCISGVLQHYVPMSTVTTDWLNYRGKAEEWMMHQLHVGTYFTQCLRYPKANVANHVRRNFLVAWFLCQMVQGLTLWEGDHTFGVALDVARAFGPCAEYYLRLWPAPCQLREYERLYTRVVGGCVTMGIEAPARIIPLSNIAKGGLL